MGISKIFWAAGLVLPKSRYQNFLRGAGRAWANRQRMARPRRKGGTASLHQGTGKLAFGWP